jgi:hypothetical protein
MTDMWDDEDRAVLAHLPFDEVAPPPGLEDRVMGAAMNARQPVTAVRARRGRGLRVALASAAAIAAVLAVVLLAFGSSGSSSHPGRIENASATRADVDTLVHSPGARVGAFPGGSGDVVLAPDGRGYLYNIRPAGRLHVQVETGSSRFDLGSGVPHNGVLGFRVDNAPAVRAVVITGDSGQPLRAGLNAR